MRLPAICLTLLSCAATCSAITVTVNNSNEDGPGSLKSALSIINQEWLGASSVIFFNTAHFSVPRVIKVTAPGTFFASISRGVTIEGPPLINGQPALIIDGDADSSGAPGGAGDSGGLSLGSSDAGEHMTLRRIGFYRCGSSSASSRGVRVSGSAAFDLTVEDCSFVECTGIALHVDKDGGSTTIRRCSFLRNFRAGPGAGLALSLDALVEQCVFDGNTVTGTTAVEGGAVICNTSATFRDCLFQNNRAVRGGAIRLFGGVLERCTFSGNLADGSFGGALYHPSGGTLLQLRNCTFHGNRSSQSGSALQSDGSGTMEHCTVTENVAYFDRTSASSAGAFSAIGASGETQTLTNCLFADNWSGTDRQRSDDLRPFQAWQSGGGNFISRFGIATTWFLASDQRGTAAAPLTADLGPLQSNGGLTPTRAPGMNAPHVNTGAATALTTDQRGSQRTSGGAPDAGAVEFRVLNFTQWAELHPFPAGSAGQNADPDSDGVRNVMEYFLGTDPLRSGPSPIDAALTSGELQLTYPVADHVATSFWRAGYQTSQSLGSWNDVTPTVDVLGTAGGVSRFRARFNAGQDRRFARLTLLSTPN